MPHPEDEQLLLALWRCVWGRYSTEVARLGPVDSLVGEIIGAYELSVCGAYVADSFHGQRHRRSRGQYDTRAERQVEPPHEWAAETYDRPIETGDPVRLDGTLQTYTDEPRTPIDEAHGVRELLLELE